MTSATVLIDAERMPALSTQLGRHCQVDGELEDGRVQVHVSAPVLVMIAQHPAGWGAAVEVVEPESSAPSSPEWGQSSSSATPLTRSE